MYRISKILRGERARINHWIYERTISNTLSNLILYSTSTTLTYKTARIRSPARHISAASYTSIILWKIDFRLLWLTQTWNVWCKKIATKSLYQNLGRNQKLNIRHTILYYACSTKKRDNLLVEMDIVWHFRGLILCDANGSKKSINLKKGRYKGTVEQIFYALTSSFFKFT